MERSSGKLTPGADVTPSKHLAIHFPIGIWRETISCMEGHAFLYVLMRLHFAKKETSADPSLWSFIYQKVPAPTCPPEELSSLSPDRLPFPIGLVSEDKVDELLLRDDGEAGTDEFGVVPCDDPAEPLNAAAAAAGLQ
ncbi:autophagocytosis associated protein (Atg3), N-terminal domain family protein [Aspergillus tubingensis]|uniref:autophagocytosis associated protein (Atg3), N-terminal domain family protein n=1 Tax=Aspergillus tubingensis TaxID=5068 RepID=UPI001577AA40|nr:autophagocytosis associated protein (Atg3), N-terminal domain family protein [Aspergillus tubingensis]GFN20715.1 autophagocytosis associated protein (Atg3), N-terminal domain family protein [Aspergillus tubingensis]